MIAVANPSTEKTGKSWRGQIAHIVEAYHESLRAALPRLEGLADQVARERRLPLRLLDQLLRELAALAQSLHAHLLQQEGHLFPMIRHVCELVETTGWTCRQQEMLEKLMDEATRADQEAVASVQRAEHCLSGMDETDGASLVDKLAKGLRELREDLEEHVHLETNVLFPTVRELLRGNQQAPERLVADNHSGPGLHTPVAGSVPRRRLDQALAEMGYRDPPGACRAFKAVLHALRNRLSVHKAIVLGTWLPGEVRGLYYENWQQRWDRTPKLQKEDFLCEVADSLPDEPDREPEETVRNVFHVLAQQMPLDDVEGVRNILPGELRSLWPAPDQIPPVAELIIADQETG
jgi:uncharacterized protein (DUF2267 family)/hemerythrin-like domain-containing protein